MTGRGQLPDCIKCGRPARARDMCPAHYQQWRITTPPDQRPKAPRRITHGLTNTKTHHIWTGMRQRCRDANTPAYQHYGGRGIKVCERWRTFENFVADMGECPDGMELDRRDNDGDYEPSNCRWATKKMQARNRRTNNFIEHDGLRLCITDWAKKLGVSRQCLLWRIRQWGATRAISAEAPS